MILLHLDSDTNSSMTGQRDHKISDCGGSNIDFRNVHISTQNVHPVAVVQSCL